MMKTRLLFCFVAVTVDFSLAFVSRRIQSTHSRSKLRSTPFETEYLYGKEEEYFNPFDQDHLVETLRVQPDTKLVIGLNKYSHDVSICAADAKTGQILLGVSKERLSRKKHDSGNVASLVERCMDELGLNLDDAIEKIVVNNHHHRVFPMEADQQHMEWETGLNVNGGAENGYTDEENMLNCAKTKTEMSHHLAHAYSCAAQSPFSSGMVVVMDGMGETYRTMLSSIMDESYSSDLDFESFQCVPSDLAERAKFSRFDWREAESVYVFEKDEDGISVKPIFKRFTEEKSPPVLYNHGFENMDSLGAVYSRASSHIFGNWNVCGKVMGLAPWMESSWKNGKIKPTPIEEKIFEGSLYDDDFKINRQILSGLPFFARNDPDLFDEKGNLVREQKYDFDHDTYEPLTKMDSGIIDPMDEKRLPTKVALDAIALASRVQLDLEEVVLDFVKHFKEQTSEKNLCLAGGVALNSVVNGRICRELGFEQVYVPPYPGDDGIAVGCCAFGLFGNKALGKPATVTPWKKPLTPYLGPTYTDLQMRRELDRVAPWVEWEAFRREDEIINRVVQEITDGGVVAWYRGRSEFGPRALGHRSILADPRKKPLVRYINQRIKQRETFRPFAPSVIADLADEWFDLPIDSGISSPYMSITAEVLSNKRARVPAITHVDGSSRLQTVREEDSPLYFKLLSAFYLKTGVPMILNTSFNTLPGEPIVESPKDAIRSFLHAQGSIDMLVLGDYIVKRKAPDFQSLLGEYTSDELVIKEASNPRRPGDAIFESSFRLSSVQTPETEEQDEQSIVHRVKMPDRPLHDEQNGGWFELFDELESEMLAAFDGSIGIDGFLSKYLKLFSNQEYEELDEAKQSAYEEERDYMLEQVLNRLTRLYHHTLLHW